MDEHGQQRRRRPPTDFTAAIYGTILVGGVVAGFGHHEAEASTVTLSVLGSAAVFWLAHVWAHAMSERVNDPRGFSHAAFLRIARSEWPMVQAATLPIVPLLLAWAGAIEDDTGIDAALAIVVLQLAAWGLLVGRRTFEAWPLALVSGLINGAFGLAIVVLKTLIH
ncbi:hypothetical protein Q5424_23085 [Conexibacter sp. JD483]|uniref:hypothetical protein n=1 Tax=unclassified Conexibacter TaxID=2627773 RepID=UPI002721C232|nr:MULTISPECIES: hypothetical protein [unclassified Conexibacter]MDO8186550.1 hypothetical protein [Conexibacter sp. CPCC 205706]MDO8200119.1 hypothetical protein [Conexibacter sp. CPCC 205762]MDR9372001.1 hypothetical protein [Conexibacter sp. JD483]